MEEDDDIMDIEAIVNEHAPLLWTRKLTSRLLAEYKLHAPKVGHSIKNMNVLHALIARILQNEFKAEITQHKVGNKLKSIKRKYHQYKNKGRSINEFGPGLEEVMKMMDRYSKQKKTMESQNEAAVQSIKEPPNDESYSVEIAEENFQDQDEVMDIGQFLRKKEATPLKGATTSISQAQDPLEGDVLVFDGKSHKSDLDKFNLLEKKIENQEKSLEERVRKNELIEERNRLVATLLTKKTKNDVIDAIRKDRLLYHQEMKKLWAERLQVEKQKLREKKRKNDLLEERNKLMKVLIEGTNKRSINDIISENVEDNGGRDNSPTDFQATIELE